MLTTHERVARGLDLLTEGLTPFVERELQAVHKRDWIRAARTSFREDRNQILPKGEVVRWDAHALLTVMWDQWNTVFRHSLGQVERSLVCELRDFRNRWAHQQEFDFDEAYRFIDSIQRLLKAVSSDLAEEAAKEKHELLQEEVADEMNQEVRLLEVAREKRSVITIYILCCAFMVAQSFSAWGWDAWVLAAALISAFSYLIYKRLRFEPQKIGPRECKRCRRIVYTDTCPYCSPAVSTDTAH